jgi:hypothetical protein
MGGVVGVGEPAERHVELFGLGGAEIGDEAEQFHGAEKLFFGDLGVHGRALLVVVVVDDTKLGPHGRSGRQGVLGRRAQGAGGGAVDDDRTEIALREPSGHGGEPEGPVDDVGAVQGRQRDRFGHAGLDAPGADGGRFDQIQPGALSQGEEGPLGRAGRFGGAGEGVPGSSMGVVLVADRGLARTEETVTGDLDGARALPGGDDHRAGDGTHPHLGIAEPVRHRAAGNTEADHVPPA